MRCALEDFKGVKIGEVRESNSLGIRKEMENLWNAKVKRGSLKLEFLINRKDENYVGKKTRNRENWTCYSIWISKGGR